MKQIYYKVQEFLQLLWFDICSYFTAIYDGLRLHLSIKLADAKQRAYNKRYYVIADYRHKLTVINNDDIKLLKKMKLMNKNASHLDIMRDCLYYTSLKANEEGSRMSLKERMQRKAKFLTYMERYRTYKVRKQIELRSKKKANLIK